MRNVTIGRYNGTPASWDGWIEGTRDDGSTWIMFLDAGGSPQVFWARRDEGGGVIGSPVDLRESLTEDA